MAQPSRKEKLSAADREKLLREEHYVLRVQDPALANTLRKELQRAPADSYQPVELTITFDGIPYHTQCKQQLWQTRVAVWLQGGWLRAEPLPLQLRGKAARAHCRAIGKPFLCPFKIFQL